jgi:hypothetical protein
MIGPIAKYGHSWSRIKKKSLVKDKEKILRTEKTGILNFRKGKQEKEWNVAPTAGPKRKAM